MPQEPAACQQKTFVKSRPVGSLFPRRLWGEGSGSQVTHVEGDLHSSRLHLCVCQFGVYYVTVFTPGFYPVIVTFVP